MKPHVCWLLGICLQCTTLLNAQQFRLSLQAGPAIGTTTYLRKSMLYMEGQAGVELPLGRRNAMEISAGISSVRFDYYDLMMQAIYNERLFFSLPVSLKRYYDIPSSTNRFYITGGFVPYYCLQDYRDIRTASEAKTETRRFTGYNLAAMAGFGWTFPLSPRARMSLGLSAQMDLHSDYNTAGDALQLDKYAFTLTYSRNKKE